MEKRKHTPFKTFAVSGLVGQTTANKALALIDKAFQAGEITAEERQAYFDKMSDPETTDWNVTTDIVTPLETKQTLNDRNKALEHDPNVPFIFKVNGKSFDVRPIFSVIEWEGVKGVIRALDTVIFEFIQLRESESITESDKSMLFLLKELRDGFIRGSRKMELSYWTARISKENKESNHRLFDGKYLETTAAA